MRAFSSAFKATAVITLSFFIWTFLPLCTPVAFAAAPSGPGGKSAKHNNAAKEPVRPDARFEKTVEKIREAVSRAGEKHAKGEDDAAEIETIRAKRAELDGLDAELRAEFSSTEKRLKDAKLPKEILERHYKFVKHYDDNLAELKANLDGHEKAQKAQDKVKAREYLKKAKAHLEKTKPPKKHVPLDPNKLPFRTVKAKERAPRLKKEEFEKEFGPTKGKRLARSSQYIVDSIQGKNAWYDVVAAGFSLRKETAKPIVLALNTVASDVPFQLPLPSGERIEVRGGFDTAPFAVNDLTLNSELSTLNLAAADVNLPTAADLSETPEIQFTPEIRAKAQEFGYNPVKIYEWVRNNIEFAPTYGSIQGAQMTMETKLGNAFDTASLLIALLRASGIAARYVYGTVEIPIEKAMNWVGGVTDPKMVGTILATNGIPAKMLISGGAYKAVQLEHTWVEAYVPYGNYRGSMRDDTIKAWIPLDSSYKQFEYKRGMDLYTVMAINGEKYLMDYITDTSTLTIPEELQAAFPAYTISPYQYYSKRLINYVDANSPSATYQDVFGADTIESSKIVIKKEYPYLLGSLSYNIIVKVGTFSSLPDNLRYKVSFTMKNVTEYEPALSYTTSFPEIAGKRITLSFNPATSTDEALIAQYGGLLNVPPYLLTVKPLIKINGVAVATGTAVGFGKEQIFNMTFTVPNIGTDFITNTVTAGDYSAIPILSYKAPYTLIADDMETLINNIGSTDLDDLLGQMLHNVGVSYFHHLNFEEELYAKNFQMIITKGISEAIVTSHAVADSLWGVPYRISEGSMGIDVDKNEYLPFPFDGSKERARDFMMVSGLGSSAWEDRVLQAFYDVPSVSAARLLRFANQQGVPVYTIDSGNISSTLTQLQVSSGVADDIRNAVNAGKKVIISKAGVQYESWNGVGYIVLDPMTGAAGYMISSGAAGGNTTRQPTTSVRNVSQFFWGDGSALRTIVGRYMILVTALSLLDTPYTRAGADPDGGFDCSGFVYYLYTTTYGKNIFGPQRLWTVRAQHDYLEGKNMTHPYDDKLDGDILWSNNYGHTGIYYGKLYQGEIVVQDTVIHASSSDFINGDRFRSVVITATNHPGFTGRGGIMQDIGRPVPDAIQVQESL